MVSLFEFKSTHSFDSLHLFLNAILQTLTFVLDAFHFLNMLIDVSVYCLHVLVTCDLLSQKFVLTLFESDYIINGRVHSFSFDLIEMKLAYLALAPQLLALLQKSWYLIRLLILFLLLTAFGRFLSFIRTQLSLWFL